MMSIQRSMGVVTVVAGVFGLFMLGPSVRVGAAELDRAPGDATRVMPASQGGVGAGAATAGAVPSGAVTYLMEVDRALDRMDRMMSDATSNLNKDDRAKTAAAALQEAGDKLQIVERRHGARMGKAHPDLVSRRERIAAGEKAVAAFAGEMSRAIQKEQETRDARDAQEAAQQAAQKDRETKAAVQRQADAKKSPAAAADAGRIVFSTSPIDPAKPANLTTRFKAGDTIYGLIQAGKTWRDIYDATGKTELGLMIVMAIGDSQTLQYITLKKAADIDSAFLVLDIAPAPEKMTAYRNPDIQFGEGKGNRKIGPIAFTYELGRLPAGTHTIQFFIRNYGEKPAAGEFQIDGSDFTFYAGLHEKVKAASEAIATVPPPGMVNKVLESQMRALLANAGWSNILRVVIVDKDWWLDGSTLRYLNVAAVAKGADGRAYWSNLQFSQPKLITGAWGALELTKTGIKRSIALENVYK